MNNQKDKLIAVIGAMEQEVEILRSMLDKKEDIVENGIEFYRGTINGKKIILLKSGIGKVNAAISTTLLLSKFKPDIVINTGSAGGLKKELNIGDIVISTDVRYHDVDVTAFGYDAGQIPGMPAGFSPDKDLIDIIEKYVEIDGVNTVNGLIVTGDAFLSTKDKVQFVTETFKEAIAAEMEAAGIAQVCHQFKIPFIVARAISDVPENECPVDFNKFLETASVNSSKMVVQIIEKI